MRVIVETDFKPEDALFIIELSRLFKCADLIVIVGEAAAWRKMPMVRHFLTLIPPVFQSVKVIQGLGSHNRYPILPPFDRQSDRMDGNDMIESNYIGAYAECDIAFMLKPPREAMMFKPDCPRTTVYCYGSNNWWVLSPSTNDIVSMTKRYGTFYLTDARGAIGGNSNGLMDLPGTPANEFILKMNAVYNQYIVADAIDELRMGVVADSTLKHYARIIAHADANMDKYYTIGSMCILCFFETDMKLLRSMTLAGDGDNRKWVNDPTSNLRLLPNGFTDERRKWLVEYLSSQF